MGDIPRAQRQDDLTDQEKGEFRVLKEFLLQKWTEERTKEKVVSFFQGCDQSLSDLFREANRVMNFSKRVISVLRATYSKTGQEKAVATVPSPQTSPVPFQLEENVIQSHNQIYYAQAALHAFQSFLANASVERLPTLRTLLLELLRTNIGVKTFCEKSGITFSHDNREFAGSNAQQFLQNIFPYFRQAITMKRLDLTSLHGVFANIQLTVLPLKEPLNAESANNFEEQMKKGLMTKQSVQLLKLLLNKCLTLKEFLQQTFPDVLRSEIECNQLQVGFDQYKIAVRINPSRFETYTSELEKSILEASGKKILIEKLHTMTEPQTKTGYLEDFNKTLESSDSEMVKAFSVTYFENKSEALEAISALVKKVGRDRTVPPELCLPPPRPSVSQVTEPEVRSVETGGTKELPKKRGRPLGWRKSQPVSVPPGAPESNNRDDDLQTPPPLFVDDQPRSEPTTAPAASAPILKTSRKKSSDVNKNIVFNIFVRKLDEATITRRSQMKPHFIDLLNKEIDMETFLNETNLIDSKSRANESNMKSLLYAFPQFLDLFKEKMIIPKDLHWSFADISYDSDQERCILRSESRRNSSEQSSEAVVVVPPPIITSSSTPSIPVETNPTLCLDFRLLASWNVKAFGKERLVKIIFTSKHLLFIPDPTINLDDLTDGFKLQNKLFPDGKSGKLWFPASRSDIYFQIMETPEDFENLFLNRHGVSEKMFLVERGAFQELSVQYDLSSGPVYGIVDPRIIRPEKEIENQENLCFSLLNDTSGTNQRMMFRGYISRFLSQSLFGVLLSEFLLISRKDEYHSIRESMFGGEDVQVRICKINQKTKLKLICPIKSEDQPLELWMRTSELKMANILETEEEISASCLDFLTNNDLVAIPKSQWSHFFELIQRSLGSFSFEVKKLKCNVECVAKYSTKLGRSAFHFYAYYFTKGERDKYLAEDLHKLDVLVVPCRTEEEEESPPEKYNIKAGVYIEQVQSYVHSVKLVMKENSTSKTSERMTVRSFQQAKYVSQAHQNRESMLTRVDTLTEAIEHR